MVSARHVLAAALVVAALAPAAVAGAAVDPSELVRDLASEAAELAAQEQQLLELAVPLGDVEPSEVARARSDLRLVDVEGYGIMLQLDRLGVDLTSAARTVLNRLPALDVGGAQPPQTLTPPHVVYTAAIADLGRIAATPTAMSPTKSGDGRGSFGLLAVAAAALLALGLAALSNTLRRTTDNRDLATMAWSDGLTGVANRRRLDRDIAAGNPPHEGPTAVIMVDVDHFKLVNDSHGHHTGDEVLRQLGSVLAQIVRHDDVVYRYGGEEFCVLLPGAGEEQAHAVAERIVRAARSIKLPDGSNVTVSVGIAEGPSHDVAVTLETADRALYAAKAGGRDRAQGAASGNLLPAGRGSTPEHHAAVTVGET